MLNFALDPTPHDEAAAMIADKPAIVRSAFNNLHDDLKTRAYTISGVEDMDVLQNTRDLIAAVPMGADWKSARTEIARQISPWFTPAGAENRAQLLLNQHCRTATATCQARIEDAQSDIFTHFIYHTNHGPNVRDSHAVLDGIIVPANSPFWQGHTPPWAYNCHCTRSPMMAEEVAEEKDLDSARTPETSRVLDHAALTRLEGGTITRGPAIDVMLPPSLQSVQKGNIPYADLASRWDAPTRADFERKAAEVKIGSGTLLSHLDGSITTPQPVGPRAARPATFAEAVKTRGLDTQAEWSRTDLANLRASMRVDDPLPASEWIDSISGARKTGTLTDKELRRTVQDLLDILPRDIADTMSKIKINLSNRTLGGADGFFDPRTNSIHITTANALKGIKGEERRREMRRTLSHELMHAVHGTATGPEADAYRQRISDHYAKRTAADVATPDGQGGFYRKDKFYREYAGREYKHENGHPSGKEIPSSHFELWEAPDIATHYASAKHANSGAFRETFSLVHSIFDSTL